MKTYDIKGTVWVQRELTWEEVTKASKITGQFWKQISTSAQYGDFVGGLMSRGVAGEVLKIILKPKVESWLDGLRFRLLAWRKGVDIEDPMPSMTMQEIARAMLDFFIYSVKWMSVLTGTEESSESSQMTKEKMKETLSTLTKSSFGSATGTSPKQE